MVVVGSSPIGLALFDEEEAAPMGPSCRPRFAGAQGPALVRQSLARAGIAAVCWVIVSCLGQPAAGSPRDCSKTSTFVEADDPAMFDLACEAAATAIETLAQCGIGNGKRLGIVIHEGSVSLRDLPVFGAFEAASRTLHIAHPTEAETLMAGHAALREVDRMAFYKSIMVHEAAHAVVHERFAGRTPRILVAEYAAFAVQFTAMPPTMREEILAHYPASASSAPDDFRLVVLLLDPFAYGAAAYRHFSRQPDRCGWLKSLLDGSVSLPGAAQ